VHAGDGWPASANAGRLVGFVDRRRHGRLRAAHDRHRQGGVRTQSRCIAPGISVHAVARPYDNKVAIASRSQPRGGFWTAEDLKKDPQFVVFFRKPFNRERYTLKTKP
jgi:hypothetical protein